ncbi:1665_t:CDS:2 [Paraglomus brasilianum]|uniref:1665_t:CDS:1 n=1 Tax=Paraglomus brasilianum TaxID=144538 RepID=A0A9N8WL49_9GLOM|nr:1665_t:CDS:2 [Paraglomus brasilianum]
MAPIDSSSITREAIALLFNAAKILAEQQTKMKIESVHFMDGRVHLNMRDTVTIDVEIGDSEEEQNLGQRVDVGDKINYDSKSVDLESERDTGENNNHFGMGMACDPVLTFMTEDSLVDMLIEQQKSHDQMNTVDQVDRVSVFEISDDDSSDESSYHKSSTKKSPVKNAKNNKLSKKGSRTSAEIGRKGSRRSTKALHDSDEESPTPTPAKGSKKNTATGKRLPQSRKDALDDPSSPRQSKRLKPLAEPSIQAPVRKTNQKTFSRKSTTDTSEESEYELPFVPSRKSTRKTSPNSPKDADMEIQQDQTDGQKIPTSIWELVDDSAMAPRKSTKQKQDCCIKKSSPKASAKQAIHKVPHIARQSSPRIYIPSSIGSKLDPKSGSLAYLLDPPSSNDLDRYGEMGHKLRIILGDKRVADCIDKLPACPTAIPDTLKLHYFRLFNVYKKLGHTREETFIHVDNLRAARLRIKQWERMDYRLVGSETEALHLQSALLFADIFNDTEMLFRKMYDETSAATRKRTMKLFSDSMTEWNASNVPILRKTAIRIMFLARFIEFDELVQAGITVKNLRCYRPQYKKFLEECFGPEVAEKLVDKEHEMTLRANEVGKYDVYRKKYKKKQEEMKIDSRELKSLLD